MEYINPKLTDIERERSRAVLDTLMAKTILASKRAQRVIDEIGFIKIGSHENIIGPPLTWLGNCTGINYMGSPKMFPLEFHVHEKYPKFQVKKVKQTLGGLLRRIYRKYLSPIIKSGRCPKFKLDLESDPNVIKKVFCSFKKCRKALQSGELDNLMLSIMEHYKQLMCDLGFSMFAFLWDQSHSIKPEHPALRRVPLFHSEHLIDKDIPMFSSYDREFKKDFGEYISEQKFTDVMKKTARQCVMDAWNIATNPYENVREFKFSNESDMFPIEGDIFVDEPEGYSTQFSKLFGMNAEELIQYSMEARNKIVCMMEFTILQTLVIRVVVAHEMQRILTEELRKSNVGLYLHAFSNTMIDLSFHILAQSDSIEEFTDTFMESCGIYDMLYPNGKRYIISHDLVDMTNLLSSASIWRDVKVGKSNRISEIEHMFLGKMLHQKCKIRNIRKMVGDSTKECPNIIQPMKDNIYMTMSGGYPICGNRPSFPGQVLLKQMAQAFSKKTYSYFLEWVGTNRRTVFYSGKEFFFYQLGFVPPIKDLMFDTTMFERHENGIRECLDECRKSIDDFFIQETVNYMVGYESDRARETLPKILLDRRTVDIYPTDLSTKECGEMTNDIELTLKLVAAGPESLNPSDVMELENQTCFLNSICDRIHEAMLVLNDMGDKSHKEQQNNYNKLVKKRFSDAIATNTRTLIPQGLSDEERESHIRKKIDEYNDAMIMVKLEQQVLSGEIILTSDWTQWEIASPGSMKNFRTKKQKIKTCFTKSFHAIKEMEWEWDRLNRRPRLISQAIDDYLEKYTVIQSRIRRGEKVDHIDPEIDSFYYDIKRAAEQASKRKDGWFDFLTWIRVLGVSRFGRQMLKFIYFQYEKCEIPDNRFSTYTEILFSLRPRDFQIIREFAACFENAPIVRVIQLGPLIAKNQLQALRKRFGLEALSPPPHDIGTSYYCSYCGNWADVKMSPDSKGFKMYGIGLEDAVYDCLTDTLHCKRQGSTMCQSMEPLETIDTIGVAVSIGNRKPVTRCATCGALTEYNEGNFTELGPTCGGHETPEKIIKKRPGNGSFKKKLISLNEVNSLEVLRKNRIYTSIDTRKPMTKCYFCSKEITTKPQRVKTIKLCYDPKPYDPMIGSFRAWMDHCVIGDNRFPVATKAAVTDPSEIRFSGVDCGCIGITPEQEKKRHQDETERMKYEKIRHATQISFEESNTGKNELFSLLKEQTTHPIEYYETPRVAREDVIILPCKKHKNPDIPSDRTNWGNEWFHDPGTLNTFGVHKEKKYPLRPTPTFITTTLCDSCFRNSRFWLKRVPLPKKDTFKDWLSKKMRRDHMQRANAIGSKNAIQVQGEGGRTMFINYNRDDK